MTERFHGTVKFFSGSKGYGFIQPDGAGSDFWYWPEPATSKIKSGQCFGTA